MHTKFERLLSKSLTTLEVVMYYLVVHTGPSLPLSGRTPYYMAMRRYVRWESGMILYGDRTGKASHTMFLVSSWPSNMLVYLRDGSAQTIVRAVTVRWKLQIRLATQSTDTGPTSPSVDPISPGAWLGSH